MTPAEASALGISSGMYSGFQNMTVEEAKTQRCEDCSKVMAVHPDARWRFAGHVIRCHPCQRKVEAAGGTLAEAMFVT